MCVFLNNIKSRLLEVEKNMEEWVFTKKVWQIPFLNYKDTFYNSEIKLVRLKPPEIEQLIIVTERFNFDFDDAYQYVIAEKYGLTIISFDTDFDRTQRGRKTPAEIIEK